MRSILETPAMIMFLFCQLLWRSDSSYAQSGKINADMRRAPSEFIVDDCKWRFERRNVGMERPILSSGGGSWAFSYDEANEDPSRQLHLKGATSISGRATLLCTERHNQAISSVNVSYSSGKITVKTSGFFGAKGRVMLYIFRSPCNVIDCSPSSSVAKFEVAKFDARTLPYSHDIPSFSANADLLGMTDVFSFAIEIARDDIFVDSSQVEVELEGLAFSPPSAR